jgi:predicted DNA-binding transcriptional regulator AlpA
MTQQQTAGVRLIDAKGLAAKLSTSVRSIRRMTESEELPRPIRVGPRLLRWDEQEIDSWINAGAPDRKTWEQLKRQRRR